MRLVAVVLSVVLLAAPAFASTPLDTFESVLETFGPLGVGSLPTGDFGKGPTPCVCRVPENPSNLVGFVSFVRVSPTPEAIFFRAACVVRPFDPRTGNLIGETPFLCGDFEALAK